MVFVGDQTALTNAFVRAVGSPALLKIPFVRAVGSRTALYSGFSIKKIQNQIQF
jgi:hypothetical protein